MQLLKGAAGMLIQTIVGSRQQVAEAKACRHLSLERCQHIKMASSVTQNQINTWTELAHPSIYYIHNI